MSLEDRSPSRVQMVRRLRRASAVVLACLVLAVLAVLLIRPKKPAGPASHIVQPVGAQKIDERDEVRYIEFRGEREKIEFLADRGFVGKDGLYHLAGHVRIVDYGRMGGRKILVSCEELVHDAEKTHFTMTGGVRVEMEQASFTTDVLGYDRTEDAFATDGPIVIASPGFQGTAVGMTYSLKTQEIWLRSKVRFETRISDRSPVPLVMNSPELYYSRPIRKGRLIGGVTFAHGLSRGSADSVDFDLFPFMDKLNIVSFRENVRLHLEREFQRPGTGPSPKPDLNPILSLGDTQDIQADEIKLRAFLNTSVLHSYESKGRTSLTFRSPTRGDTRFRAESIDFVFNEGGVLREFRAAGGVRVLKTGLDGETQTIEGDFLLMPGTDEILQISAGPGRRVTGRLRGSDLKADVVGINVKTDDFQAASVRTAFLPGPGKKAVGLFSSDQPVFITSRWMEFISSAKRYRFYGGARMWQGKSQLLADEAQIAEETGAAVCQGAVRSLIPHTPKDGRHPEEIVEISSRRMEYDPDKNTAVYEDEAALKTGAFRLTSRRIRVQLAPETREAQTITALEQVVIVQPDREARGETADYRVDEDLVILTGRPVVTEKNKGETRGDKLTFRLADGTILVENETRTRSVTKIKS